MPMSDEKKQQMDNAGSIAEEAIPVDDLDAFRKVAIWWKAYVGEAGHRRLGRILMQYDVVQSGASQSKETENV